ncbi:MAG: TusE/DsrC/DsvC family sulfur relay protein [Methylococcales bacterium]|nr:TusE/DsrC/DsvC family sulfur relay protein [Methylococcales bacterium]
MAARDAKGFLLDWQAWTPKLAEALAQEEALTLTDAHWEIIDFMRHYYAEYQHLPNTRLFSKAIATTLGEAKGNSRYLKRLFPNNALYQTCLIAGLPKPPICR